jgi:hypothetical protein
MEASSAWLAALPFPDRVCVTWPGGANAVDKADWPPLAGRTVWLWPDHDDPGYKAAERIAAILRDLPRDARTIRVRGFPDRVPATAEDIYPVYRADDLPDGRDAADAAADGWTAGHMAMIPDDPANLTIPECLRPKAAKSGHKPKDGEAPHFEQREGDGPYFVDPPEEQGGEAKTVTICKPCLYILKTAANRTSMPPLPLGEGWGEGRSKVQFVAVTSISARRPATAIRRIGAGCWNGKTRTASFTAGPCRWPCCKATGRNAARNWRAKGLGFGRKSGRATF